MKTDISKTKYTPLIDSLVHEVGILGAAVFGRVWRYCQMERGYCHAEQGRIADELELSRGKVNECLRELVEKGYLGSAKNTKGRTIIYYDTGKAGKVELPEFNLPEDAQNTEPVTITVTEPVSNGYTKKEKKEKNTTTIKGGDSFSFSENKTIAEKSVLEEQEFLANASEEQKSAFQKIRLFAGVQKSIEKASVKEPLEAARSFLLGIAKHGDTTEKREMANKVLAELPSPTWTEEPTKNNKTEAKKNRHEELEKEFLECAHEVQIEAYKLIKPFVGVVKAIEKANEEDPIMAVRALVEFLAENGNTHAMRVRAENAMKKWEVVTFTNDPDIAAKLEHCGDAYKFMTDYAMEYASENDNRFEWRIETYKIHFKNYYMAWFFPRNADALMDNRYLGKRAELEEIAEEYIRKIYELKFKEEDAERELQVANF